MSDFHSFVDKVQEKLNKLSSDQLFITIEDKDSIWDKYLSSFPEGTDPMFRERTEHDCSSCRNFIKNFGSVVSITNGKVESIWSGLKLEYPYSVVAEALDEMVINSKIVKPFFSYEPSYGSKPNFEETETGVIKWKHFYGEVSDKHHVKKNSANSVEKLCGDWRTNASIMKRGFEELSPDAIAHVTDLIEQNMIYRGSEHLNSIKEFSKSQKEYNKLSKDKKEIYIWKNANNYAVAHFRNSVIGTLIQDLSDGVDLEEAVKSFEQKVAPANYKRPKALITPAMVKSAMKKIAELDIESSLERRFAKLSDVSVNNVLWVDSSSKSKMKDGGLEDLLMSSAVKKTINSDKAKEISIEEFASTVLPQATEMSVILKHSQVKNLVSITAPVHSDSKPIFKWDNNFAWSYNGNITDSELRESVSNRGGRVDGVFRFSHMWNYGKRNASLMDLHVFMPGSKATPTNGIHDNYGNAQRVGWNNRVHSASGGVQDVDYTAAAPVGYVPVENITFPDLKRMPGGTYICKIHNWSNRYPTEGGFKAEIEFDGQVFQYERDAPLKNKEWVTVAEVTLRNGQFSIKHHMPSSASQAEAWGIETGQPVKVNVVMKSPNYWDDNSVGNEHWFFMLDNCKNPDSCRGIYNEFLSNELNTHRKVFEVLGDKTKCQPTDDQLSGVGFSSTKKDSVTIQVKMKNKQQLFEVVF